jgi:hypothetical protein
MYLLLPIGLAVRSDLCQVESRVRRGLSRMLGRRLTYLDDDFSEQKPRMKMGSETTCAHMVA